MVADQDDLLPRGEALERVRRLRWDTLTNHPTERVSPGDGIADRVIATDIVADHDSPEHDRATMDGYAVRAPPAYPLKVVDQVYAEDDPPTIDEQEAVSIATGAALPSGADAVLRSEEATVTDGELTGVTIEPGTYTYRRGSNFATGDRLFEAGERLGAQDAILLAELGVESVEMYTPFRVGVLATGSEIADNPGQDFDSAMLLELFRRWGAQPRYEGSVPDDLTAVRTRIDELADEYDVVVTTGGTSVGSHDYVIDALEQLGEVVFHRVRIRPGKPLAFADLGTAIAIAIPGKPVGAYIVTSLVVRSFFEPHDALPRVEATCPVAVEIGDPGFEYAIPVTLDEEVASPLGHRSSPLQIYDDVFDPSVLSSATRATRADGMVLTETGIAAGETVTVIPFDVLG